MKVKDGGTKGGGKDVSKLPGELGNRGEMVVELYSQYLLNLIYFFFSWNKQSQDSYHSFHEHKHPQAV